MSPKARITSHDTSYKQAAVRSMRALGLLPFVERRAMAINLMLTQRRRSRFERDNPGFALPPPDLAFDAFGSADPHSYQVQGVAHAQLISQLIKKHHRAPRMTCDWGCGPLRILRHMPSFFGPGTRFVGLDYNPGTIEWCRRTMPDCEFRLNGLTPPLPLDDNSVDVIYCISVFTHLSEKLNRAFLKDIGRCLKPDGILVASTHGDRYRHRLSAAERAIYDSAELVVRGNVEEGKRLFVSFHSPQFARRMFKDWTILEHNDMDEIGAFQQDHWVVRCNGHGETAA